MPPLATGGVLAATGMNTTLGIVIVALTLLIGSGLLVRDRLLHRKSRSE